MKVLIFALTTALIIHASFAIENVSESIEEIQSFIANDEFEESSEEFSIDRTIFDESLEEFSIIKKVKCTVCKKALSKVMEKVPKGAAKDKIRKQLDRVCNIIPTQFLKAKCQVQIEKKGDMIAEAMANKLSSSFGCKIIAFC